MPFYQHICPMNINLTRRLFLGVVIIQMAFSVFAGGVAEFGTVSKSKITLNPAGAAAIDRILFDFTAFNYEGKNRLSPLSGQIRRDGYPGELYFEKPYSGTSRNLYSVQDIVYNEGEITGSKIDFAYPTRFFTVGVNFDFRKEDYKEGYYQTAYNTNTEYFSDGSPVPGVEASIERQTTGVLLAIPLKGFSLGIRQNSRELKYKIGNLNGLVLYDWNPSDSFIISNNYITPFGSEGIISGKSTYQYKDYGVMFTVSGFNPRLDIGFLMRPPVEAILEFNTPVLGVTSGSSYYTMTDLPFTEPGLNLITTSAQMNFGRVSLQMAYEIGNYIDAENSLEAIIRPGVSTRERAYDIDGYLVHIAYNPIFSLTYGVRSQEIAGSLTELNTLNIKFPVPFFYSLILSMGKQDILIKDDSDAIVAQSTSYSFSAEMKFGKSVSGPGRQASSVFGSSVPPKTKKLPYSMEF